MGTLNNTEGLEVGVQYFIDRKPAGVTLANDTKTLTTEQIMAAMKDGA